LGVEGLIPVKRVLNRAPLKGVLKIIQLRRVWIFELNSDSIPVGYAKISGAQAAAGKVVREVAVPAPEPAAVST